MSAVPGLADRAASLLEADPWLGRMLGRRDAAAVGHRAILPVLSVEDGPWAPPEPASLGTGTVALAVLDGLLVTADRELTGPGDVIEPWGAPWIACTPVRLAVIGRSYLEALRPWPAVADRVRARAAGGLVALTARAGAARSRSVCSSCSGASRRAGASRTGPASPSRARSTCAR